VEAARDGELREDLAEDECDRHCPAPASANAQIIGGPPVAGAVPKRVYVLTTGER
jgi:hypothetical protein